MAQKNDGYTLSDSVHHVLHRDTVYYNGANTKNGTHWDTVYYSGRNSFGVNRTPKPGNLLTHRDSVNFNVHPGEDVESKIRTARRLKISGIVLTCASPVFLGGGIGLIFSPAGSIAGIVFTSLAFPLFIVGLPIMVTGMVLKNRWQRVHDAMQFQTGMLPNGHVGLGLTF